MVDTIGMVSTTPTGVSGSKSKVHHTPKVLAPLRGTAAYRHTAQLQIELSCIDSKLTQVHFPPVFLVELMPNQAPSNQPKERLLSTA